MSDTYTKKETAARYDTARGLPDETYELWKAVLREMVPAREVRAVLDLGGGTGRFAPMLRDAFDCPVTVVDPAEEMLRQGRQRGLGGITYRQGSAERLPLGNESIDLVWMCQVFHHLEDRAAAYREIDRVLRPGGYLVVRNGTVETDEEMAWRRFFPEARDYDVGRIPLRREITTAADRQGLHEVAVRTVLQRFAASPREYCEKIGARGLSALVAISDEAFTAGMAKLREWAAVQPDEPVDEPVDAWAFQKAGD